MNEKTQSPDEAQLLKQKLKEDVFAMENIIAIGMNENDAEVAVGASLPTLNDNVKKNLSYSLILSFVKLNSDLSVLDRLGLLLECLSEAQGKRIKVEFVPSESFKNHASEAIH